MEFQKVCNSAPNLRVYRQCLSKDIAELNAQLEVLQSMQVPRNSSANSYRTAFSSTQNTAKSMQEFAVKCLMKIDQQFKEIQSFQRDVLGVLSDYVIGKQQLYERQIRSRLEQSVEQRLQKRGQVLKSLVLTCPIPLSSDMSIKHLKVADFAQMEDCHSLFFQQTVSLLIQPSLDDYVGRYPGDLSVRTAIQDTKTTSHLFQTLGPEIMDAHRKKATELQFIVRQSTGIKTLFILLVVAFHLANHDVFSIIQARISRPFPFSVVVPILSSFLQKA